MKKILALTLIAGAVFAQSRFTQLTRWDTTSTADVTYIGKAVVDNPNRVLSEDVAMWQIKAIKTDGIYYARTDTNAVDGTSFNKVWTNRTEYVYTDKE